MNICVCKQYFAILDYPKGALTERWLLLMLQPLMFLLNLFLKVIHMRFTNDHWSLNLRKFRELAQKFIFSKITACRPSTLLLMNFVVDIFKRFGKLRLSKIAQNETGAKKQSARPIKRQLQFWSYNFGHY